MIPMVGTTVLCILLGLDGTYSRIDGAILFGCFILYSFYLYQDERKFYNKDANQIQDEDVAAGVPTNEKEVVRVMLGELIDLISGIALGEEGNQSKDILGRVYEYFLGQFAGAEGKRGGEFYTPRSVVRVLVEMLEPFWIRSRVPSTTFT